MKHETYIFYPRRGKKSFFSLNSCLIIVSLHTKKHMHIFKPYSCKANYAPLICGQKIHIVFLFFFFFIFLFLFFSPVFSSPYFAPVQVLSCFLTHCLIAFSTSSSISSPSSSFLKSGTALPQHHPIFPPFLLFIHESHACGSADTLLGFPPPAFKQVLP